MILARVVGTVVATRKDPRLEGHKLLIIQPVSPEGKPEGGYIISIDTVSAGNRELVISGENGYLVRVGDRAGFAQSWLRILDDPALRACLGEAGRRRMLDEFSVPQMVERHAALYRELLG